MSEKLIIKLGGSLLTDKQTPYKLNQEILNSVSNEIQQCLNQGLIKELVIVHGVGSFGHPPVLKYNLHKGFKSRSQLINISETQYRVNGFRQKVTRALFKAGIPVNYFHSSSIFLGKNFRVQDYYLKPLKGYLDIGLVPVIGGDMMFDTEHGFSVLSGDIITIILAKELKMDTVVFATDVKGVFNENPKKSKNAKIVKQIKISEIAGLIKEMKSENDASNAMAGKLSSIMELKNLNFIKQAAILTMRTNNILKGYLEAQDIDCTRIVFD